MAQPFPESGWKACDALTRAGERCTRKATAHWCTYIGTCLGHVCTQHDRLGVLPVEKAHHKEVYSL